jgi:hypothetical protein
MKRQNALIAASTTEELFQRSYEYFREVREKQYRAIDRLAEIIISRFPISETRETSDITVEISRYAGGYLTEALTICNNLQRCLFHSRNAMELNISIGVRGMSHYTLIIAGLTKNDKICIAYFLHLNMVDKSLIVAVGDPMVNFQEQSFESRRKFLEFIHNLP